MMIPTFTYLFDRWTDLVTNTSFGNDIDIRRKTRQRTRWLIDGLITFLRIRWPLRADHNAKRSEIGDAGKGSASKEAQVKKAVHKE